MGGFALQGSKHDEGAAVQCMLLVTYSVSRPHVDASLLRAGYRIFAVRRRNWRSMWINGLDAWTASRGVREIRGLRIN
ncbi:MAG: hypothetical protein ACI9KE_006649 [Polyangiales bacterium]|jgi:hypothetical protein